jgi:hypothetical protein
VLFNDAVGMPIRNEVNAGKINKGLFDAIPRKIPMNVYII